MINNQESPNMSRRTKRRFDRRVTIRISRDLLEAVVSAAANLQESKSAVIKRSILRYLDYHLNVEIPLLRLRQITDD